MQTMWCQRDVGAYFAVHDGNPFCRQNGLLNYLAE